MREIRTIVLVGVFTALVLSTALLFIAVEDLGQSQQASSYIASETKTIYENAESGLPSELPPLTAATHVRSDTAVLDNDMDHDGNYDGIADPLLGLAFCPVALVIVVGLVALVGRFLLAYYELPKLFSLWRLVLERPG